MTDRGLARLAGVLFITATVADIVSATVRPGLAGAGAIAAAGANLGGMTVSALLLALAAFACAGTAVAMYPVLRRSGAVLALGGVVFRAVEAAGYLVAAACLMALMAFGRDVASGGSATGEFGMVAFLLVTLREQAAHLAVLAFCVGAMQYYALFFQARLVPRWLSVWGIVSIAMLTTAVVLAVSTGRPISAFILLAFPILVQEMVLAAWLIAKGFRPVPATLAPAGDAAAAATAPATTTVPATTLPAGAS